MQGIVSGGLLVLAFAAVAGLALVAVAQLYRISRPARSPLPSGQTTGRPGGPPDA